MQMLQATQTDHNFIVMTDLAYASLRLHTGNYIVDVYVYKTS